MITLIWALVKAKNLTKLKMIVGSYLLTILSLAYTSSSFFCQTPVPSPDFSLVLGVDFVLPLSQEQQQQEQEQQQ